MPGSAPNSDDERLRRYVNALAPARRYSTPPWTLRLLAVSVACGILGGLVSTTSLSMILLIVSTVSAAAALVIYFIETRRRPRLGRIR